jgi:hypothetical protein
MRKKERKKERRNKSNTIKEMHEKKETNKQRK